jgi:hypothetical protein
MIHIIILLLLIYIFKLCFIDSYLKLNLMLFIFLILMGIYLNYFLRTKEINKIKKINKNV